MSRRIFFKPALGFFGVVGLTACGGGGGSSAPTVSVSPPPVTVTPPAPTPAVVPSTAPVFTSAPQTIVTESQAGSFYTVTATDAEGDAVTLSMLATGDAAAFSFNASTGALSPSASSFDYEAPQDANDDNIYNLTFQAEDATGLSSQMSLTVSVDDVRDATGFGLDPNVPPAGNFELIDWRLDYPLNAQGQLSGQQDAPSERDLVGLDAANPALGSVSAAGEGFEHPLYFHTGADGGLVMHAPVIGATTSSSVSFTRTEFREMLRRGDESISTNTDSTTGRPNLNNWAFSSQPVDAQAEAGGVDGELRVTMAVNAVTTTGDDNQVGRLIIGQIHASNDEPLRLYYRKLPGNTHGSIYVTHEPAAPGAPEQTFNIIGSVDDDQANPSNGFLLGELFTYQIIARGNAIDVIISQEGVEVGRTTVDQSNSGFDVAAEYLYFKAGNYHVNNTADEDEYAELTIYELENSHEGYDF